MNLHNLPMWLSVTIEIIQSLGIPAIVAGAIVKVADKKILGSEKLKEKQIEQKTTHDLAVNKGLQALLRQQLIRAHEKFTRQGYCAIQDRELVDSTYEAYHGLGGNGIATKMVEDIHELPIESANADKS